MELNREQLRTLNGVFFAYNEGRIALAKADGGRFVYYTTAATGLEILRCKEVWLRNAVVMSDFSEIEHGLRCLNAAYQGPGGDSLKRTLDGHFPGIAAEIEEQFRSLEPAIRLDTFLACVSEHRTSEDRRGRLSMWRAYGGRTGVAIVFSGAAMFGESGALGATASPVLYADESAFATQFALAAEHIERFAAHIAPLERQLVQAAVFQMFRFAAVCTKHPGFAEEEEWRVVASPSIQGLGRLKQSIETVNGVPQLVLKLRFENAPEKGLVGLEPTELIERVIVGPCDFPWATQRAFQEALSEIGFSDAERRVIVSDIPLRQAR